MPLRPDTLVKCWPPPELSILPFLAPRVFAPWPANFSRQSRWTQHRYYAGEGTATAEIGSVGCDIYKGQKPGDGWPAWLIVEDEDWVPKVTTSPRRDSMNAKATVRHHPRPKKRFRIRRVHTNPRIESINRKTTAQLPPQPEEGVKTRRILSWLGREPTTQNKAARNQYHPQPEKVIRARTILSRLGTKPATQNNIVRNRYRPPDKPKNPPRSLRSRRKGTISYRGQRTAASAPAVLAYHRCKLKRGFVPVMKLGQLKRRQNRIRKCLSETSRKFAKLFKTYFGRTNMNSRWNQEINLRRNRPRFMGRPSCRSRLYNERENIQRSVRMTIRGRKIYYRHSCSGRRTRHANHVIRSSDIPAAQSPGLEHISPRRARRALARRRVVEAIRTRQEKLRPACLNWQDEDLTQSRQAWHRRFSLVEPLHTGFLAAWSRSLRMTRNVPLRRAILPMTLKTHLAKRSSSAVLTQFWLKIPRKIKVKYWQDLMIFTIERYPTTALKVLVGTYMKPYPPGYAVSNCLDAIISFYLDRCIPPSLLPSLQQSGTAKFKGTSPTLPMDVATGQLRSHAWGQLRLAKPDAEMAKKLTAAIIHIIQTGLTDICLSQTSLYLLLMTLDVGNLGALFDSSRHNGQYWGINYLFQMASRFSKAKKSNLAFDTLQKIAVHPSGANFNALSMHMLFSTLLRYENRADRDTYSDGVLWEFVTSRGLRPNSQHYNILIANNFQRGNAEGAWAVYQAMLEDNITPTAFTHSVLLTYSKRSLDRVAVQRALALIRARNMQMNPYLANDHLHSIFLFYRDEYERIEGDVLPDEIMAIKGRPRAFEHMLPVYCAYFDPRPLALCLGHRVHDYPQLSRLVSEAKDLMQPSKETLTIMYIGLLYGMTDARDVIEAYHQFRTLLRHEDPEFVSRLHQSHIYDAFLMKFGKFPDTLERCPKIVEDMLTTSKSGIESIVMHTDATFYQNLIPTTHTWNILLHVYAYRGQMIAAHRVLEIMQERDIAPTKVTWGTLATGYARVQNIPGTLNATDHLTEIGARDNAVGTLALNKIKDTRTLYATMEAMEKQKAERLAAGESLPADAKEDLAVRRVSRIQEAITDMDNSAWHKRQYWDNVFKKFRKPKAQVSQPGSKKPSLVKRLEASINLTSHKLGFQSPVVEAIPSKETNSWTGVAHWHTESPVEGKIVQLTLPAKSEKGPRRVIIKALKYINNLLLDVEQRRAITPSGVQPAVALEIAIREAMLAASSNITAEQEDSASSSNKYIPESEGVEKPGAWSHEAGLP